MKDPKAACQITVPPDWGLLPDSTRAAVFQHATTAIAVVLVFYGQCGVTFRPVPANRIEGLAAGGSSGHDSANEVDCARLR